MGPLCGWRVSGETRDAVARLLEGKTLDSVIPMLRGIPCREGTSCPDQLVRAFESVRAGTMAPAPAIPVESETEPLCRVAVVADVNGKPPRVGALRGCFRNRRCAGRVLFGKSCCSRCG